MEYVIGGKTFSKWTDAELLEAKLKAMGNKEAKKAVRKGVTAGRKETLLHAKNNASRLENVGTGMAEKIAASLVIRVTPQSVLHAKDAYAKEVQFNVKKFPELVYISSEGVRSFIPFAIEYGHAGPFDAGGAKVAAPKPFMRRAHDLTKRRSITTAKKVIANELHKAWNK